MKLRNQFDEIFFTTVRIEAHPEKEPNQRDFATGFFVERIVGEQPYLFLVTCRHVIEGAETGLVYFMEGSGGDPLFTIYPAEINHFQLGFVHHPNPRIDVTVMHVNPLLVHILKRDQKKAFVRFVRESEFATSERLADFQSIEDLIFVGYPAGVYDHRNGLPIARRGMTASPLSVDYEGDPIFLIDGAIRHGSSGSPVFVASTSLRTKPDGSVSTGHSYFVGVAAEFLRDPYHRPNVTDRALDLGVVYKPIAIRETIDEWFVHSRRNDSAPGRERFPLFRSR